jgi:hypothetical protein
MLTPPDYVAGYYEPIPDEIRVDLQGHLTPILAEDIEYPPNIDSDQNQMNIWGSEAVNRAAPGTSPMNLAVALGELKKDGLPSVVGSTFKQRSSAAKKAGDEYLNVQFGWAPLVRDVTSLANTIAGADSILNQLERDAGRIVRRRLTLVETDDWTEEVLRDNAVGCLGNFTSSAMPYVFGQGQLIKRTRTMRKVWFSGAFTYYLPPDYYSRDAIRRAAARSQLLFGLKLTPEVLWNLAPWSWAADWFSNAGEVISNTQRFLLEGLVMHHGYLMEHTRHEHWYSINNETESRWSVPPLGLLTETKSRIKANPFGFGVDFSGLSGFQTSILVALGMSRGG